MESEIYIGRRLSYGGDLCTVRYLGPVQGTKGEWLGVEWDDASRGKHDGQAGGVRYFSCISKVPTAASFVRPNRPTDGRRTLVQALRYKYASEHTDIVFQNGRPADKVIKISGKEVEEVGFEKIRKQLAELHELKIVLLDGLCVHQPVDREKARNGEDRIAESASEIGEVCPKITELDLSRNLFEHWHEVASICKQLHQLKNVRVDGNRFAQTKFTEQERGYFKSVFQRITTLSLEENILTWSQAVNLFALFPILESLSLSNNHFVSLGSGPSLNDLHSITNLTLESNDFTSLSDLSPLTTLPSLRKLTLKKNNISSLIPPNSSTQAPTFASTLTDLDLSHNAILQWSFINALRPTFPGLKFLRISHNPLFLSLQAPDGRTLTADDGYLLTIARLPHLKSLNYSAISPKDALNAASYYLSLIAMELSYSPEAEAESIKKSHPRWEELCEEYGEPQIKRSDSNINPRSLGAQLLRLKVHLSSSAVKKKEMSTEESHIFEIPKSLSVYSVLGVLGKHFGLPPMKVKLMWETGEWDVSSSTQTDLEDDLWDSEEEENQDDQTAGSSLMSKKREVEIIAGTRDICTWIEGAEANVRVEML